MIMIVINSLWLLMRAGQANKAETAVSVSDVRAVAAAWLWNIAELVSQR